MQRREFIAGLGAVAWPVLARAQQPAMPVIGYLDIANNPQQSWGFGGEPPEAVMKDSGTRDGTL
jgi:hypothetical protein